MKTFDPWDGLPPIIPSDDASFCDTAVDLGWRLNAYFAEFGEFCVFPIQIFPRKPPLPRAPRQLEIFNSAIALKRQSLLHGYLKWFSYCWLTMRTKFTEPKFETAFNIEKWPGQNGVRSLLIHQWVTDVHQGRFLERNPHFIFFECGRIRSYMNLVAPLFFSEKTNCFSVWLPYPKGIARQEAWSDWDRPLNAFLIRRAGPYADKSSCALR